MERHVSKEGVTVKRDLCTVAFTAGVKRHISQEEL